MQQLVKILVRTTVFILVIVALLISTLRYMLPHLENYHDTVLNYVQEYSGLPINIQKMEGEWHIYGPSLLLNNIQLDNESVNLQVEQIYVELDVWKSLFHLNWQFRDLSFQHVKFEQKVPSLQDNSKNYQLNQFANLPADVSNFFLRAINYFNIYNSQFRLYSLSGEKVTIDVQQLTWLNQKKTHKAEGTINVSSDIREQTGLFHVIIDLTSSSSELLHQGTVYLQADNVDLRPWLTHQLRNNTGLINAHLSLAAWLNIKQGELDNGLLLLKQGKLDWEEQGKRHLFSVVQQQIHFKQYQQSGWQLQLPSFQFTTDNQAWPKGHLEALWLPDSINNNKKHEDNKNNQDNSQLRLRLTSLQLERIRPLLPIFTFLDPELFDSLFSLEPTGTFDTLAIDIPLQHPENSYFQARWQDIHWPVWQHFPGVNHLSGEIAGNKQKGYLNINLKESQLPYQEMFQVPLEIESAQGKLFWQHDENDHLSLWSDLLDVQAKNLWLHGDFSYKQMDGDKSHLNILAGIRLTDAKDAWLYYPESLLGKNLTNYLTNALQAGHVDNATLLFSGDPAQFPYRDNSGILEIFVPLRQTIFHFQPDWIPFTELAIDLNFINDGLWMTAESGMLGNVYSENITANIPRFGEHQLFVEADIHGLAQDVTDYLNNSILKDSVGSALKQIIIDDNIMGHLSLHIPLSGDEPVDAKGKITFDNNTVTIKNLSSELTQMNGDFYFHNSQLTANQLNAQWFGQPLTLSFSTTPKDRLGNYVIKLETAGDWQLKGIEGVPEQLKSITDATINWNGHTVITLPDTGLSRYDVKINANLALLNQDKISPLAQRKTPINVQLQSKGTPNSFSVSAIIDSDQKINSQWLIENDQLRLVKAIWESGQQNKNIPELPNQAELLVNLPKIDLTPWLPVFSLLTQQQNNSVSSALKLPNKVVINSPAIKLANQYWRNISLEYSTSIANPAITISGKELHGTLQMHQQQPWLLDIQYLYYNPYQPEQTLKVAPISRHHSPQQVINFRNWPGININCHSCWLMGQNIGKFSAELRSKGNDLQLLNGSLKAEKTQLLMSGEWKQGIHPSTHIEATVSSEQIDNSSRYYGVPLVIHEAPVKFSADLNWNDTPWQPDINSLSGNFDIQFGYGHISNVETGYIGKILRLISFSSLMRKLRFEFSDTFSDDFYFNYINIDGNLTKGHLKLGTAYIDGAIADISVLGNVDLVNNKLNLTATVAPELSTTLGAATAFVNPVLGAAVLAVGHVLTPLWSQVSFIRYNISGNINNPDITEKQREINKTTEAQSTEQP